MEFVLFPFTPRPKLAEVSSVRPMNGGNGVHSYSQNSTVQRKAIEVAKELINKAVFEELDMNNFPSSKSFKIADLGCSVGPNTLLAVQNIIDAVKHKFQTEAQISTKLPQFQVFFNDQASNDFNQLFASLHRTNTQYFAAGVPGSFYQQLFPKDSLDFVHSSNALHWLSRVPKEVEDNGGIYYSTSSPEVVKAFEVQYGKDMDNFLNLRAREIVKGGIMVLIIPGRTNGTSHNDIYFNKLYEQLESALIDMAKKGKIRDGKLDSFIVPVYFPSLHEVESVVHKNGCFSLKIMEKISYEKPKPKVISSTYRAGLEGTIKEHFGEEIIDELFDVIFDKKVEEKSSILEKCESISLFVLLKRVENEMKSSSTGRCTNRI